MDSRLRVRARLCTPTSRTSADSSSPVRATGTRSDVLVTRRRGYLLRVEADELDAWRAARLIADGRATLVEGDAEAAEARFTDALTLWRGPSFGDLADEPYLQSEATRLDELRLSAIEERVQARISLGRHGELCAEIEGLVGEHPFRERLWEQWMLTLYRSGRQADALRAYQARPPAAGRRAGHRAWRLPSPPRGGDPRPRSRARLGSRAVGSPRSPENTGPDGGSTHGHGDVSVHRHRAIDRPMGGTPSGDGRGTPHPR